MNKLLKIALILFLAAVFNGDSPPGWFQQTIPIGNKFITDIQFLDSLNGWVVTDWGPAFDTGYVFKTIDGGSNWNFQYRFHGSFTAIQMTDANTGYATGSTGSGKIWKTTNGGINWGIQFNFSANPIRDLSFVNNDTGWVCSEDPLAGGVFKTTNGGINWLSQLGPSFSPFKIFFINKDTGWMGTDNASGRLYITTNGGSNWNLQFTSIAPIESIFFLNPLKGWIRGGTSGSNGVAYTTNGGSNWVNGQGDAAGYDIKFVNDSIGYTGMDNFRIMKSKNGGKNWGYQTSPIYNNLSVSMIRIDTLNGWAGGNGLVHTTDGGGPITYIGIQPGSTLIPSFNLKQNYPNPFNPATQITFEITKNSKVSLKIFDITGRETDEIIDYERYSTGTYTISYEADEDLSSGVYFYQMTAWTEDKKEIFIDTKKMILVK